MKSTENSSEGSQNRMKSTQNGSGDPKWDEICSKGLRGPKMGLDALQTSPKGSPKGDEICSRQPRGPKMGRNPPETVNPPR